MKVNQFVLDWFIKTVKEDYPDDVALVITHNPSKITDHQDHFAFFIPATKRGEQLARTFILDGVGIDIWAVSWERSERFAELKEYYVLLPDCNIAYARTPEDRQRFEALKRRCETLLADPAVMRRLSLESYSQAKSIYLDMFFSQGSDVKLGAGYVLDYLARAIAFLNGSYFKKAQADQLNELKRMQKVPEQFAERYMQILYQRDEEQQKRLCRELIDIVHDFLLLHQPVQPAAERNFQDLSDWYAELAYTWLRIRHYAQSGENLVQVYMWAIYLQNELNEVCTDFGLEKMELMSYFDPDDLSAFVRRADELEEQMRQIIVSHGAIIHEYASIEEFLNEI